MCVLKPGAAATASVLTSAANMAATVRGRGETRMRAVLKDRRPATRASRRLREERVLRPPDFKGRRTPPARYEAGRLTRSPLSSAASGETRVLHERGDALLGDGRDPVAGRETDLRGVLDALGHDVSASRGLALRSVHVALDGATVAAEELLGLAAAGAHRALQAGARLADVALEL